MKSSISVVVLGAVSVGLLAAQEQKFTAHAGGGFTMPVRDLDSRVKPGWNILAGAGVNVVPAFSVVAEFHYNDLGISDRQLAALQMPDGSMRVYGATIDPVIRFGARGPVRFYVTGGGGIYHRTVEFTQPTVATITVFDPWWGIIYPANVPANQILASYGQTKGGVNGGAGFEFRLGHSNTKLFAEVRYHHVYTQPTPTTILPVNFGLRW